MKAIAPIAGLILIVASAFGGYQYSQSQFQPGSPAFDQAAKTGQILTIVQVVDQAIANPCRAINLFNKADENNPKEVNLINVTCEGLNLPDINRDAENTEG